MPQHVHRSMPMRVRVRSGGGSSRTASHAAAVLASSNAERARIHTVLSSACPSLASERERRRLGRKQRAIGHGPPRRQSCLAPNVMSSFRPYARTLHRRRTNHPTSGAHPVLQTSYSCVYDGCGVPVDCSTATQPIGAVGGRLVWMGDGTVALTVVAQRMSQLNS